MSSDSLSREDAATLHLHLWLQALNRTIGVALRRQKKFADRLSKESAPVGALTPNHASHLLDTVQSLVSDGHDSATAIDLNRKESAAEKDLILRSPVTLPLLRLSRDSELDAFERAALLIIIAPQILSQYARLYGYLVDDLTRGVPSVELILKLTNGKDMRDGHRRGSLGPGGALRRLGLISAPHPLTTPLTMAFEPAPGLVEWLLGTTAAPPVPLVDAQMLRPLPQDRSPKTHEQKAAIRCLASTANALVGIWGNDPNRHDDSVLELAAQLGLPVYQSMAVGDPAEWAANLSREAAIAKGANAILWIETKRVPATAEGNEQAAILLARLPQRIILTGRKPWRPAGLIGARPYSDIMLPEHGTKLSNWPISTEAVPTEKLEELERYYSFGWRERRAAAQLAMSELRFGANGAVPKLPETLDNACKLIATPAQNSLVTVCTPDRRLEELILPDRLHSQIEEISRLAMHVDHVDRGWGFGRLTGSSGSLKLLFTGDPGTGKTMAADVIAGSAGVSLMKVDLSQVISKWVGETEKNLESVFDHAEQSNAALFFDEADSLFGKRGEVRHGTDRYANLEVSYLLQRLETFSGGLVILASNMRDEIDPAFTRRFQVALNFPRPERNERIRLWQLAFSSAPLSPTVNIADFAELDLTGGAIMTAARMAALLAAANNADCIEYDHLVSAIERQFRKEARLMTTAGQTDGLKVARTRV